MPEKLFWMPCFVNTNPAALVGTHELQIYYWHVDRCKQNWSILNKDRLVLSPFRLKVADAEVWDLAPALFLIQHANQYDVEHIQVWLNDIDDKWIKFPQNELFAFAGGDNARIQLAAADWIEKIYRSRIEQFIPKSSPNATFDTTTGVIS